MNVTNKQEDLKISFEVFKKRVISDYKLAVTSRECSVLGRREVFSGKGKFGIFGDGKELPQLAMNHFFKNGDFRSGYYRDQTLLMAQGHLTVSNIFSALYADDVALWVSHPSYRTLIRIVNEEIKKFAKLNNYKIIPLDELIVKMDIGDFFDEFHTTISGSKKIAYKIYDQLEFE